MHSIRCSRWLLTLLLIVIPASLFAQIFVSVGVAPPPLPIYDQPPCPDEGYIWIPGYWAYGPYGYFWVPGTWAAAPVVGYLWTPGYWGWGGDAYLWHAGYWGPEVGFYGGVPYGYGYNGYGYEGGYWRGRQFYYNRAVNNVNVTNVHNTYYTNVSTRSVERVSYNGPGGIEARPTAAQEAALRERHVGATSRQLEHQQLASRDRSLLLTTNHGRPPIAATAKPTEFHGSAVVPARSAPANASAAPHGNENPGYRPVPTGNQGHPNGVGAAREPGGYHPANPNGTPASVPRPPQGNAAPHNNPTYGNSPQGSPHVNQPMPHNAEPAPHVNQPMPRNAEPAPHMNQPMPHNNQPPPHANQAPAQHPAPPPRGEAEHPR